MDQHLSHKLTCSFFFGILEPPAQQYDGMFGQEDYAHLLTVAEMLGPDVGWESP